MFATFPLLYQDTYGFSTGVAGLVSIYRTLYKASSEVEWDQAYLGPGIGFALSTFYGSYVANGIYLRVCSVL